MGEMFLQYANKNGIYHFRKLLMGFQLVKIIFLLQIRSMLNRVKSDNFGQQVNSDSDIVCFVLLLLK